MINKLAAYNYNKNAVMKLYNQQNNKHRKLNVRPVVRLTTRQQIKQWCQSTVESNMLNDKRIKSCLSRFNSGAYSRLQLLRAVSHSVGAHTESRGKTVAAAAAARMKTRTGRRPCQQRQLQGRRNRQRKLLEIDQSINQTSITILQCAQTLTRELNFDKHNM